MPELPDIEVYVSALRERILDRQLERIRIVSPFILRTVQPSPDAAASRQVIELRRLGKRIAIGLDGELWLVVHLMVAGRLHWHREKPRTLGRQTLVAFDFESGSLTLTEAGKKRRASLHVVEGESELALLTPPGLEVLEAGVDDFTEALRRENHTLKRTLTDPHLFSGIGNAYSDEILHRAKLSPIAMSQKLDDQQVTRLFEATQAVLREWLERLSTEAGNGFPTNVTAFRTEMAVHGKFGKPCPVCCAKVQRIRYVENETNYCAGCQTGGKMLADRSLSQLLKKDWPKTLEEWEALMARE